MAGQNNYNKMAYNGAQPGPIMNQPLSANQIQHQVNAQRHRKPNLLSIENNPRNRFKKFKKQNIRNRLNIDKNVCTVYSHFLTIRPPVVYLIKNLKSTAASLPSHSPKLGHKSYHSNQQRNHRSQSKWSCMTLMLSVAHKLWEPKHLYHIIYFTNY